MTTEKDEITKRRLRWKCRRGMLELDLFLIKFFDNHYDDLNETLKKAFARLLEEDDTKLWAWFLKVEQSQDPEYQVLINKIVKR